MFEQSLVYEVLHLDSECIYYIHIKRSSIWLNKPKLIYRLQCQNIWGRIVLANINVTVESDIKYYLKRFIKNYYYKPIL